MSVNKDKVTRGMSDRGQFCMVPNELATFIIHDDAPTSAIAERIWLYLFSQSETWEPGQRKMADDLRVCTSQIKKGLNALQQANMLTIMKPDRKGLRDLYELQVPDDWNSEVVHNGTVNPTLTGCQSEVDSRCPSEVDTYKTKQEEKTRLEKVSEEKLDYLRSDLINAWTKTLDANEYDARYNSFLVILGNLRDQGNLDRDQIMNYEMEIKESWCSKPGKLSAKQRKGYEIRKKLTDQDFNSAVSDVYSSVDLEDVEIKEINTPVVIKVEEYIPPPPDKILTLEKLEKIGEDTVGDMKLDYDFLKLCESVGEKE